MKKAVKKVVLLLVLCIIIALALNLLFGEKEVIQKKSHNVIFNVDIYIFSLLTLYSLVFTVIANIKKNITYPNEYERNPENVISPIIAEAIIDGKIDGKNLCMTCIVNRFKK